MKSTLLAIDSEFRAISGAQCEDTGDAYDLAAVAFEHFPTAVMVEIETVTGSLEILYRDSFGSIDLGA